jgi:hypothetical protein
MKRRKLPPTRRPTLPLWAWQLLNGEPMDNCDPETVSGMFDWLIADAPMFGPGGLPGYSTAEGRALRERAGWAGPGVEKRT